MLYTDIPTPAELRALDGVRGEMCVSIFLPTTPVTRATKPDRITFRNLIGEAVEQLVEAKAVKRRVSALAAVRAGLATDLASMDLAQIAHAAARGQVATLLVDVTANIPGAIDRETGKVTFATKAGTGTYDLLDELVGLTLRSGGDVLPISAKGLSEGSHAAAVMRFRN